MNWNKWIIRIGLLITFVGVNALILFGISSVWSYLNTGADRSSRLHLNIDEVRSYLPKVEWDTTKVEGRPIEPLTLAEIERDYLNGWYVKNTALFTNNRYGISDYFTDSARVKLQRILDLNKSNQATFKQTSLNHHPKLDFYSADGTQVYFTDHNVHLHQESFLNGQPILNQENQEAYRVIMLLEDGFWRVRHFTKFEPLDDGPPDDFVLSDSTRKLIRDIKGLNYYPQDTPWDMFGKKYNDTIITKDFNLIKAMGLNTIRIFIPYEDFGAAHVDFDKLAKVRSLLDLAEKNNLKVVVTLFDFYGNYDVFDWTLNHRHTEQIVTALKDHKAILAWDVKNEPDLDFESRGKETVLAWLKQMFKEIRKWDTEHPITVGWASPEAAANLSDEVDFVSFHYYKKLSDFTSSYDTLKTAVANDEKPIVLQEYGLSSYSGVWNAFKGSEEEQAAYYEEMQSTLRDNKIPFLLWTLYDFRHVPKSVVGSLPWRKQPQRYFGCYDVNGRPKAASKYLIQY